MIYKHTNLAFTTNMPQLTNGFYINTSDIVLCVYSIKHIIANVLAHISSNKCTNRTIYSQPNVYRFGYCYTIKCKNSYKSTKNDNYNCWSVECYWNNRRLYPISSQRFHVLLNSLFKVLCNFPSRYLLAIGLVVIFSLRWSLPPTLSCDPRQLDSKV